MKKLLAACILWMLAGATLAQGTTLEPAFTKQVEAFLDGWHKDAANADMAYFDKIAKDGIYIGTDKSEHWTREQFMAFSKPYFERKKAWDFTATKRHVYASEDRKIIWFDELLATWMGVCQASGVLRNTGKGFEILHYQLSIAVPNDASRAVIKVIQEFESKPAGAK